MGVSRVEQVSHLTAQNTKPFRYLDLPAELQLRVIHFAVTDIHITEPSYTYERDIVRQLVRNQLWPGPVAASAQMLCLTITRLALSPGVSAHTQARILWLSAIGSRNRQCIRGLVVELDAGCCGAGKGDIESADVAVWFDDLQVDLVQVREGVFKVTFV